MSFTKLLSVLGLLPLIASLAPLDLDLRCQDGDPLGLLQTSATVQRVVRRPRGAPVVAHQRPSAPSVDEGFLDDEEDLVMDEEMERMIPNGLNETAAEVVGVEANQVGDLFSLVVTCVAACIMILLCYTFHYIARYYFPLTYNHPAMIEETPNWIEGRNIGYFSMVRDSLKLTLKEIHECSNLDHAMLIEYTHLGMKLMLIIGLPSCIILAPMHGFLGGNRSGADNLSKQGMANVVNGSWLYWVHCGVVWGVVLVTNKVLFREMKVFIERRSMWLKRMPKPQDTTILLENLPTSVCTDAKLRGYFNDAFGREVVQEASVVKIIGQLESLCNKLENAKYYLKQAEEHQARTGERAMATDRTQSLYGQQVDAIQYYTSQVERLDRARETERQRILVQAGQDDPSVFCTSGFVTFKEKRDAEMALHFTYTPDDSEFIPFYPPDPSDVIYSDLQVDPSAQRFRDLLGYGCIVGIIILYLPLVVAIATLASLENVKRIFPFMVQVLDAYPICSQLWNSLAASMALLLVLSFLPSILLFIGNRFFVLRGSQFSQLWMQESYYWIMVVHVLLVTAIGSSVINTTKNIVEAPTHVLQLLAATMPNASHFYLNYMATSWTTHSMIFTRYIVLGKYLLFRMAFNQEDARAMSEPEDQDYYGMGSRSARFTLMLVIGLVYCTLAPLMCVLTFIHFALCRIFYGYLFVFCEDRSKPDLGGVFFVKQMHHTSSALFIYIVLMAGVLLDRASTNVPGIIALTSGIYHIFAYNKFKYGLRWESLSLEAMIEGESVVDRKARRSTYVQYALEEPEVPALPSSGKALEKPALPSSGK